MSPAAATAADRFAGSRVMRSSSVVSVVSVGASAVSEAQRKNGHNREGGTSGQAPNGATWLGSPLPGQLLLYVAATAPALALAWISVASLRTHWFVAHSVFPLRTRDPPLRK